MNQIINIKIQGQQPSTDSLAGSLKLAQEIPEQSSATVFDVATIIDQMHGVENPCQNTRNPQSYHPDPAQGVSLVEHQQAYLQNKYSTTSALEGLASEFGGNCLAKQGKPVTIEVFAFWSNEGIADDYKLICPVGRIDNQRRVQKRMRLKISVSGASSVDFGYYVKERVSFSDFYELFWVGGNVVDIYGKRKSIPAPQWDGETQLYWGEPITNGHIFVEFDTIYDIWDCTLQGVWTDSKRDYAATVTGIWAGTAPELPLVVPKAEAEEAEPCSSLSNTADAVDLSVPSNEVGSVTVTGTAAGQDDRKCYQVTITYYYHPCTGDYVRSGKTQVPAPCDGPDDLDGPNPPPMYKEGFIGVGDPDFEPGRECESPCTPEGYEEICCRPPAGPGCVPTCTQWKSKNQGGLLPPGGMDALKQEYGDDVQIEWVYPEDGNCGTHTDKLVLPGGSCDCEKAEKLAILDESVPEEIAAGGSVIIVWEGGISPFSCSVSGKGFFFAGGETEAEVNGSSVYIYATAESCGTCNFEVEDECGKDSISLRSSNCVWNIIEDTLKDTHGLVDCGSRQYRYVDDWCSPGSCTGSGTNYCGPAPDPEWTDIEGNKVSRCDCP